MAVALAALEPPKHLLSDGRVVRNTLLCDEHYRITLELGRFPSAFPGQFVHLGPVGNATPANGSWQLNAGEPLLRRAFSIAGLRRNGRRVEIDVIYRVVGSATHWLAKQRAGDFVSILGPQGNRFPVEKGRRYAWLVAGGVGLPPLLWFAEELAGLRHDVTFFYGAQRASLTALDIDSSSPPASDAGSAVLCAASLTRLNIPVVASTDDGSLGFRGHLGQALEAFWRSKPVPSKELALYTCGPERMMAFVAAFAARIGAICYVCVERSMACATGMCQSCVVPVRDERDSEGWRYRLCCTDGPIFDSRDVIWDFEAFMQSRK